MIAELALVASLSGAAGFSTPPVGVETAFACSSVRVEAAIFSVAKEDGGSGRAQQAAVLLTPGKFEIGLQVTRLDVERYLRDDLWVILGYGPIRAEYERESWRLSLRPKIQFNRWFVRPSVGYVHGRGADGVVGSIAVGAQF